MCTPINCPNRVKSFGPDGCQVPIGNGVCGEKRTLDFINEFKKLYERKMEEIDANGSGDCKQVIFPLWLLSSFCSIYSLCVGAVCTYHNLREIQTTG